MNDTSLFPQLDPPPGGLARLRAQLADDEQVGEQVGEPAWWRRPARALLPATVLGAVLLLALQTQTSSTSMTWRAPPVSVNGLDVNGAHIQGGALDSGVVLVWLPPTD